MKNIKELAVKVHKLKPIVTIGSKGLTDAVQLEIDRALEDHELIKIRIVGGDKEYRGQITDQICQKQNALLVKKIGHIIAIFRKSLKKD